MISVIIPFHNEEGNLSSLLDQIVHVSKRIQDDWEVVFIDDGSKDDSLNVLHGRMRHHKLTASHIQIIESKRKMGKGRALTEGFEQARGEIIVFMDADLQDDPHDIPRFLEKIKHGYDFVNGWRASRQDKIDKTLPSKIFNNFMLRRMLRSSFHDINCGFKAMRREILEEISLYGDNYRFLPLMAEREGFYVTEVPVTHHPRKSGKSKYGFFRMFYTTFDTLTIYFIYSFAEKPLHFFGLLGGGLFGFGFVISLYLSIERLFFGELLYQRPLLLFAVLLIIVGIQVIMTGIIGELIVYHTQQIRRR